MRLVQLRSLATTGLLASVAGCASEGDGPNADDLRLAVVRAPAASSLPGAALDSVIVRVVNQFGTPVAGLEVEWTGDGTIDPEVTVSDDHGLIAVAWTLPRVINELDGPDPYHPSGLPGVYRLRARGSAGQQLEFSTDAHPFRVDQVAAAFAYACGVVSGTLWCWGHVPTSTPLGFRSSSPQPVVLPGDIAVSEVRVGDRTLCARDSGGHPHCAGVGTGGQFVSVTNTPALVDLVSAGATHCGRAPDQRAWCWSISGAGPFVATQVSAQPFERLTGGGSEFAFNSGHLCGLTASGAAWCWGSNVSGQLGDGTTTSSATPVAVSGNLQFVDIAASFFGTCGLTADGSIWCWGSEPTYPHIVTPTRVLLPGVAGTRIVLGAYEGYVFSDGAFTTWWSHELLYLDPLLNLLQVEELSSRGQSCIRDADRNVYCSWILIYGGSDASAFPSAMVPVPQPEAN